MRASQIASLLVAGASLVSDVVGADEPAQDRVTAECKVVRLPADLAHEYSAGHYLRADAAGAWIALQSLVQTGKAELVADLNVTAKTHERATGEQGIIKLVVDSVPTSIPGGMLTDIQVRCANCTTTTSSTWKTQADRFFGPYESTWKDAPVIYLAFLHLQRNEAQ